MAKIAFISGITGQDGSYLSELLLSKGYEVYGMLRRTSKFNTTNIDHIRYRLHLKYGDLTDGAALSNYFTEIVEKYYNTENLKAQLSVSCPPYTGPSLRCQDRMPIYPKECNGLGKVISFSYIRQDIQEIFMDTFSNTPALLFIIGAYGRYAIIYDNTLSKTTLSNQIFCTYDQDGGTGARNGDQYKPVGCNDIGTIKSYNNYDTSMLINYKNTIKNPNYPTLGNMYNEVIIKSWVDNSNGSINSGIGISNNVWGWKDALQYKPILAFGILLKGNNDPSLNILHKTLQSHLNDTSYKIVGINTLDMSYTPFFSI